MTHKSDCAVNNAPAMLPGRCDCGHDVLPTYPDGGVVMDEHATRETVAALSAEIERLRAILYRYRHETPLGHQPHMIGHKADEALENFEPK